MNGKCVTSVGKQGGGPLEFDDPCSTTISPITGQVYVADRGNHRVQVLKPDLTFSHTFGTKGSGRGQFNYPRDVAINRHGLAYVTDCWNHRIQIFTPEGQYCSSL